MRSWQVTGKGEPKVVLAKAEKALEAPGPGELRIKVIASALALPDVLLCRGTYPLTPPGAFTPGLEFVGTVLAAGPHTTLPVGSKVMGVSAFFMGHGAFADECKAYEQSTYLVPEGMNDVDAAAFTIAYQTAHVALVRRAQLKAGETVLVHGGAGGTGFAAIQLAKALGAKVVATAGGAAKAAVCRSLGADVAIDYTAGDFVPAVKEATGGKGVDIVFDPVGGEVFEKSAECVAPEGRLLPIGFACGRWGNIPMVTLTLKNLSIIGAVPSFPRPDMVKVQDELAQLYRAGKIKMLIDRKIGFDGIRDGLQDLADRKVNGRVVAVY
ncbi:MAG: NADPH:quinone oxidoreductase family protein [Rhodospirillaceae bacterium]|nr:NADPH:quinone oxidoreductase family protein [Rhodospirillaceae bacterium]